MSYINPSYGCQECVFLLNKKILNKLTELLGFWSVSALALTTGTLAYSDTAWSMAMREKLNEHAERLDNLLQARGYKVLGSVPLFRLIESLKSEKTWQGMMKQGVYVRKFRVGKMFF